MPLVFKLVGYNVDNKHYEIRDPFNGPINLTLLYELFKVWGILEDEMNHIKFITDSEQIKDLDKCFLVNDVEDRIIFVFTSNNNLIQKLYNIFVKEGKLKEVLTFNLDKKQNSSGNIFSLSQSQSDQHNTTDTDTEPIVIVKQKTPDPEICQPLTQTIIPDLIPILTLDIINNINIKTVSLFSDPDFKNLIGIYIRRPELFSTLAKYIQHGTVIEESLELVKTQEMLSDTELQHYMHLCEQIKNIGINLPDNIIIARLLKYSGHLNLTVRSLLCEHI